MPKKIFITAIILSIFTMPSFAFFSSIGLTPLKIRMSARPLSLGEAFTTIPDVDSQFYNPGCMPWTKGISINMQNFNNIAVSQAYPTGNDMTIGLAFAYSKSSGIKVSGGGTAEIQGSAMVLTYSTKLSSIPFIPNEEIYRNTGIGASFKFLLNEGMFQQGRFDKNGTGYDIDAGIYYKAFPWLSFGAMGGNLLPYKTLGGGVISWKGIDGEESIPSYLRIGASAKIIGDLRSPVFVEGQELNISADIEKPAQSAAKIYLGGEYTFSNTFSLRAGANTSNEVSFGVGYKASGWGLNLSVGKNDPAGNSVMFANIMYFPEEWHFLSHPFEYLNPESGFETYRASCEVYGKIKPGITLSINQNPVEIKQDRTFSHIVNLTVGQNTITAETLYENDRLAEQINVARKALPVNPFANINIYDNYIADDPDLRIEGRIISDASSIFINGEMLPLSQDKSFETNILLENGENHILSTVFFDDQPVKNDFLIYKRTPAAPVVEKPKPIKKKAVKVKSVKKKHAKKRHVKRVDKSLLKNFKQIQELIKAKTSLTILSEAEIRLSGYFAVYVLSDFQYIALRDLRNGIISIEYYETVRKSWKTLATASYGELLLFKTSSQGRLIDFYLDN